MVLNDLRVYPQGIKNTRWGVGSLWPEVLGNLGETSLCTLKSKWQLIRAILFITIPPVKRCHVLIGCGV